MDARSLYGSLLGEREGTEEVSPRELRNGAIHLSSLGLTKSADGLIDPKLVLSWALNAAGAPAGVIGALVPVREAGALLPQLLLAPMVERTAERRWFWVAGSAVQGLAALGMAWTLVALEGAAAGWAVLGLLAVLAVARSSASVSYKDVLARSIPKTRRGGITGTAGSVASGAVLLFGALLAVGALPLSLGVIAGAIALAGGAWLTAAALFGALDEVADDTAPARGGTGRLLDPLADPQFRRFVLARALLTGTALAPPFLLLTAARVDTRGLGELGPLVLASALAAILSAYVWGRLSDRSSRLTLAAAAALGAASLGGAAIAGLTTGGLFGVWGAAAAIFAAQIAYQGVRAGRSLHVTDMTGDDTRARYTALSNTLIGAVLIAGGGFGILAEIAGPAAVLACLACLSALAVPVALSLDEVQAAG